MSTTSSEPPSTSSPDSGEAVLRTLAPALRHLERNLRNWLDGPHRFPLTMMTRATLEGLGTDLSRQAEALDVERPLLVIMLMGGTGVGKSTLLNALAGGAIAQASFARPTTKDPVVYYHESIQPERLDPALQQCRLKPHDRADLMQKILVDTPDLDSNDLENREILYRVLPVADIVLYVGSQEKYHDRLGWDLFMEQRRRRAFAFILNKWDRCQHAGAAGLRPDEDLIRDLQAEGFDNPLVFRTCAQMWVDQAEAAANPAGNGEPTPAPVEAPPPVDLPVASAVPDSSEGATPTPVVASAESPVAVAPSASEVVSVAAQPDGVPVTASAVLASERVPTAPMARPRPHLPPSLPEGEQFADLVTWINKGLNRMEIEAIKARGISQLLGQLQKTLESARPPDLGDVAGRTRASWERLLSEEAQATAEVLLNTLEPYQREIEHHFSVESQRRFRGLMASYLNLFTRVKFAGNSLRDRIPFLPRPLQKVETPAAWDLSTFTRACSSVAGERHLDARGRALANRLLVEADQQGYPLDLLNQPTEAAAAIDWRQRYAQALIEILQEVEKQWSHPTGARRLVQGTVIFLADWVPSLALLSSCVLLLWQYTMEGRPFDRGDIVLPFAVLVIVLIILHILIASVLPMRWPAMRGEFHRQLERRLEDDLETTYSAIPAQVADALRQERRQVEKLVSETREVFDWLRQREQAASIAGLYGN